MPRPKGLDLTLNSPEEEARINAGIAADPDTFEWTDEEFARARPASEMMPPEIYQALVERRARGPQKAPTKEMISVRLDRDLVERLRATGPGWQARINATLRKAVMG
jgi:uncharacterized protein (DUF4415 family)